MKRIGEMDGENQELLVEVSRLKEVIVSDIILCKSVSENLTNLNEAKFDTFFFVSKFPLIFSLCLTHVSGAGSGNRS